MFPTLALTLSESSPYAHADGDTVYYGLGSGAFTVTAQASDVLAGLAQITFPETTSAGHTYAFDGESSAARSWDYTFTSNSRFGIVCFLSILDISQRMIVQ